MTIKNFGRHVAFSLVPLLALQVSAADKTWTGAGGVCVRKVTGFSERPCRSAADLLSLYRFHL